MDRASLIGLILGVAAIVGGQALEGGQLGILMQPAAFVIVVVGTLAAVLLHHPLPVFLKGLRMARWAFRPPESDALATIRRIVQWSHAARTDGVLALEKYVNMTRDPFQKTGLQLLIDGADAAKLRDTLDVQIVSYETHERQAARVWEIAGGYAPTLGILGAVLGQSSFASPGGLIALLIFMTRPSPLVVVPSSSAQVVPGKTTSACLADSDIKKSIQTLNSKPSSDSRILFVSGSETIILLQIDNKPLISPSRIFSKTSTAETPASGISDSSMPQTSDIYLRCSGFNIER